MTELQQNKERNTRALSAAILAQVLWGLLAIYWKWLAGLAPYQILVHRVLWSAVFLQILLMGLRGKRHPWNLLRDKSHRRTSLLGGVLVSINWLIYIWSVNSGRILEASLGYYILPLMTGLFGYFLGERFNRRQWIAFGFAMAGVLVQVASLGRFPVFSIILAISFSSYTVVKKQSKLDAIDSLYTETVFVLPIALLYMVYGEMTGGGITGNLPPTYWLRIATSGVITAVPLLLYGYGTRGLPLRVTAFIQYLNPTLALLLGVLVYQEPFGMLRFVSFVIIWIGVLLFTFDQVQTHKRIETLLDRQGE